MVETGGGALGPAPGANTSGSASTGAPSGLPCDLEQMLVTHCQQCHLSPPRSGAPMPLVTYADLMAPARSQPSKTVAALALSRIQDTKSPMPPAPNAPLTSSDTLPLSNWLSGGMPHGTCSQDDGGNNATQAPPTGAPGSGPDMPTPQDAGDNGVPCDVETVLADRCQGCHTDPPLMGVPMPLMTYAQITAQSVPYPSQTILERMLVRMQSSTTPMPPAPAMRATSAEIAVIQAWASSGAPTGSCGVPATGDGGTGTVVSNPYNTPSTCSSGTTWTGGNHGSPLMNPGQACITCHTSSGGEEAPHFALAGTVYPTAHEPNNCNGVSGSSGAGVTVVIVDANNQTITVPVNNSGNFSYTSATFATPFRAKVVSGGKERLMGVSQTSGDCNSCHTETGANGAPGRIMAP